MPSLLLMSTQTTARRSCLLMPEIHGFFKIKTQVLLRTTKLFQKEILKNVSNNKVKCNNGKLEKKRYKALQAHQPQISQPFFAKITNIIIWHFQM